MSDAIQALPLLLQGALVTLVLSVVSMAVGLALGLAAALLKLSRHAALSRIGAAYISAIRGTPLLVQLFLWSCAPAAGHYSRSVVCGRHRPERQRRRVPGRVVPRRHPVRQSRAVRGELLPRHDARHDLAAHHPAAI